MEALRDLPALVRELSHPRPGPRPLPRGEGIVFASSHHDPAGRNFDLFLIHVDGTGLERITRNPTFDGFPMWSHDGRRLAFASNRGNAVRGETNVFVADWID